MAEANTASITGTLSTGSFESRAPLNTIGIGRISFPRVGSGWLTTPCAKSTDRSAVQKSIWRSWRLPLSPGESVVEETIRVLLGRRDPLNAAIIKELTEQDAPPLLTTVEVEPVSLAVFDELPF